MCLTLGASIAEVVSAYPTCGGMWVSSFSSSVDIVKFMHRYTASAQLTPKKHRAKVW
jgi:hypothetical protein